ncbi:hypothetical protein HMI55_007102 [Coelomomyces lativittatus]|nr:hypothetical protein HMI55_007102 [Coelomomyces lativittatus]
MACISTASAVAAHLLEIVLCQNEQITECPRHNCSRPAGFVQKRDFPKKAAIIQREDNLLVLIDHIQFSLGHKIHFGADFSFADDKEIGDADKTLKALHNRGDESDLVGIVLEQGDLDEDFVVQLKGNFAAQERREFVQDIALVKRLSALPQVGVVIEDIPLKSVGDACALHVFMHIVQQLPEVHLRLI